MSSGDKADAGEGRGRKAKRLREVAMEASERLDRVLPQGEDAEVLRRIMGVSVGEEPGGRTSGVAESREGRRTDSKEPSCVKQTVGGPVHGDRVGDSTARPQGATTRQRPPRSAGGGRSGGRTALVAHVSPGIARTLCNLLKHMGLTTTVASIPQDLDREPPEGGWDVVLVQGSAMPWPGLILANATLKRWSGSNAPLGLITRPGDTLMPETAGLGVSCVLEWPFRPEEVRQAVSELLRSGART